MPEPAAPTSFAMSRERRGATSAYGMSLACRASTLLFLTSPSPGRPTRNAGVGPARRKDDFRTGPRLPRQHVTREVGQRHLVRGAALRVLRLKHVLAPRRGPEAVTPSSHKRICDLSAGTTASRHIASVTFRFGGLPIAPILDGTLTARKPFWQHPDSTKSCHILIDMTTKCGAFTGRDRTLRGPYSNLGRGDLSTGVGLQTPGDTHDARSALVLGTLMAATMRAALTEVACAQDFPSKPIHLISGFLPGGSNDIVDSTLAKVITSGTRPTALETWFGALRRSHASAVCCCARFL